MNKFRMVIKMQSKKKANMHISISFKIFLQRSKSYQMPKNKISKFMSKNQ